MKNSLKKKALELHEKYRGKISIKSKVPLRNRDDLSLAYTPGVAEPCNEIVKNPEKIYDYTSKGNIVAVVSDGSAVLGLGDIGGAASLPVMEGKAILFKEFADIDAFPICIDTKNVDKIVETVKLISPVLGGINLEDISAPRCFAIEQKLKQELDIPVFHDDQHGTAVVVLAALMNALKVVGKKLGEIKIAISGAGAAGNAVTKFLLNAGAKNIVICDSAGIIFKGRERNDKYKEELAELTNSEIEGNLSDAIKNSDVFIGVSAPNIVTEGMIKSMDNDAIVFAMANPVPEIMPDKAKSAGARIVATGRSDFPNQVNNLFGFPGIFRGALDVLAKDINEKMKKAAVDALANLVEPNEENILPSALDKNVVRAVASAVSSAAIESGIARIRK